MKIKQIINSKKHSKKRYYYSKDNRYQNNQYQNSKYQKNIDHDNIFSNCFSKLSFTNIFLIITAALIILISSFNISLQAAQVTDLAGRKVDLPEKIEKIAAVGPGALRVIVYLEAENMVVGVEEFEKRNQKRPYILAHPELLDLAVIGPQFGGDAELIAAQEPDLIFASYLSSEQLDNLKEKTDIAVLSINDGKPGSMTESELFAALDFIAPLLNKEERAAELKAKFMYYKEDLKNKALDLEMNKKAEKFYIGGIGHRGAQGLSSTEAAYPPFRYLGIKNIIESESQKNFSISSEELLLKNPDIIFIDQGGLEIVKKDLRREEFSYLKAIQNQNLYGLLPYNHYTTNFATMLADSYYIGKVLYGDKFLSESASEKADQIYKFFVGKGVYSEMRDIFGGFIKYEAENFE